MFRFAANQVLTRRKVQKVVRRPLPENIPPYARCVMSHSSRRDFSSFPLFSIVLLGDKRRLHECYPSSVCLSVVGRLHLMFYFVWGGVGRRGDVIILQGNGFADGTEGIEGSGTFGC